MAANETETRAASEFEIQLRDGETLTATVEGDRNSANAELATLHDRLVDETFVSVGDVVFRSEEVRWVRLRSGEDRPGLLKTLLAGGDSTMETRQERTTTGRFAPQSGAGYSRGWSTRPMWDETKPFAFTSEFVAYVLVVAAIAICTAVFDELNVWRGMLLITAVTGAYLLSRGIAKAGTAHSGYDPRALRGDRSADGDDL